MPLQAHAAPLYVSGVTLAVNDLIKVSSFYEAGLGLDLVDRLPDRHVLGVDGVPLITLDARANAVRERPESAGLFHTAFVVPDRAQLGGWLRLAAGRPGIVFTGMSDHGVSEALYLDDPEGNGIEVYVDRPRAQWVRRGSGVEMTTLALDREGLVAAGEQAGAPVARMPSGTRIGHIHLRVGDLTEAEQFYGVVMGLDLMHQRPQARFFASGGYHHHIAANTWASAGAAPRIEGTTGLVGFEITATDAGGFDDLARRFEAKPASNGDQPRRFTVTDRSGLAMRLVDKAS